MMKKNLRHKSLALLLTVLMLMALLPAFTYADGEDGFVTVTIGNHSPFTVADGAAWDNDLILELPVPMMYGETVIDILYKALTRDVNTEDDYDIVIFDGLITSISNVMNDWTNGYSWMGAVNQVFPSVGLGSIFVKPGDNINIQYLDYNDSDAMASVGSWGNLNSAVDGFAFSSGRLSAQTIGWDTVLTLMLPQDVGSIQVNALPASGDVEIFLNDDRDVQYAMDEDIPVEHGDVLWILIEGYENAYEINICVVDIESIDLLLESMAAEMTDVYGEWQIIAMSAYRSFNAATAYRTSANARQSYINYAVSVINDYTKAGEWANQDAEYAKAILALQSIGVDPGTLFPINSQTSISAFDLLNSVQDQDMASLVYASTSPIILHAFLQSGYDFSVKEEKILDFLLSSQDSSGAWGFDLGEFIGDEDSTSMVIAGLSGRYLRGDADVVGAVDAALVWLAGKQHTDGTFGSAWGDPNADSTAQAIMAMCAVGLDPHENSIFSFSAVEGLLSFVTVGFDGFQDANGNPGSRDTWSGFTALVSVAQYYALGRKAFNVYDFSGIETQPGRATGEGSVQKPPDPSSGIDISVSFTLNGLNGQSWIGKRTVMIQSDARIYHLFTKVLSEAGYGYEGADIGYISSVTTPSGTKLSEFQYGVNSGWIYSLNGDIPTIGMLDCRLYDGDEVVWYYTGNYKNEPGMDAFTDNTTGVGADVATIVSEVTVSAVLIDGAATATVSEAAIKDALRDALDKLDKSDDAKAAEVKVSVTIPAGATKLQAEIPASALKAVAKEENALLTIDSAIAAFTLDSKTLAGLTDGLGDTATVSFIAETVDVSTLDSESRAIVGDAPVFDLSLMVGDTVVHNLAGTVTVFLPYVPDVRIDPAGLTVYWLNSEGQPVPMEGVYYDADRGGFMFTTDHFSLFFIAAVTEDSQTGWRNPFTDVQAGDWYYDVVRYAYESGLMVGTAANRFSPDMAITRGMVVTVLWRADGSPGERVPAAAGGGMFSDVGEEAYYYQAVNWASANGVVSGYGGGLFGPDDAVTREQFAAILSNYASGKGYDTSKTADLQTFSDAAQVAGWARGAVGWANAEGLLAGRTLTTLVPQGTTTRAEAAAIFMRFDEDFVKTQP